MRRRDVLRRAGALAAVVGGAGAVAGTAASSGGRDAGADQEASYAPRGRLELAGAKEAVVGEDGTTVYVAATDGFATVDVSDPASPTLLAERRSLLADRDGGPMDGIYDVKVGGDRLLVAGPANPQAGLAVEGFLLFDVSDPADPEQVAFHETGRAIHNAFLDGEVAYLTAGAGFAAVDVTGDEPEPLGRWGPHDHDEAWRDVHWRLRNVHDVWVQDDVAFLATWDAGTFAADVSDPADPSQLARLGGRDREVLADVTRTNLTTELLEPPGNDHYVMPSADGSLLAIGKEAWDDPGTAGGGPAGVELWDVGDLDAPTRLSTIEPPPTPDGTYRGTWTTSHNFDLVGDRLYTSWYQGGVKLFDVSDPAAPRELAWWRRPDEAAFWTAKRAAGGVFVASAADAGSSSAEALYTFPDEPGEQADPPSLTPSPSPTPTETPGETPAETPGETPTDTPTPSPSPTPTETPTETPSPTDSPTPTPPAVTGDGLGLAAGTAALASALWWRARERDDRKSRRRGRDDRE